MATQQDIIKNFMEALDEELNFFNGGVFNGGAVDEAFKKASGDRFNNMQEVIDAFLADCSDPNRSVEDFLREECGIILDNEDTGAITGFDAGGTKIKTDESIVPEVDEVIRLDNEYREQRAANSAQETLKLDDDNVTVDADGRLSFTKPGLSVKINDYDKIIADADSTDETKRSEAERKLIIINGLYTWWIENSLVLIKDSYYGDGYSFSDKERELSVTFKNKGNNGALAAVVNIPFMLPLEINMYYTTELTAKDPSGLTKCGFIDGLLAHEFTHVVMQSNFDYLKWFDLPKIMVDGTAELTRGIDNIRGDIIVKSIEKHRENGYLSDILDYDIYYESNQIISHPINFFFNKDEASTRTQAQYAGGYMLLRYFANQCADEDFATAPTRTIANQTITKIDGNGQRITANNGTALVTAGDTLKTDADNNIVEIAIGNSENIVSTPESETPVIIKNSAGEVLASIIGSASVHENGYIHKNLSDIKISTEHDNITTQGGNGNDSFTIGGISNTVNGDAGDDSFTVSGSNNKIYGDSLDNTNLSLFVIYGDNKLYGNDSFIINGDNNSVYGDDFRDIGGIGNDSFTVSGNDNHVDGGNGNDSFTISGNDNYVNGSNGNDSFIISGSNNKVDSSNGNDKFLFTAEARNNTICSVYDTYTLQFETSDISIEKKTFDGNDYKSIIITSGKDTLLVIEYTEEGLEAAENIIFDGKNGEKKITSISNLLSGEPPTTYELLSGTYSETLPGANDENNDLRNGREVSVLGITNIKDTKNDLVIEGLGGNDTLVNYKGTNVSMDGGQGNDTLYNIYGSNVIMNGGADKDEFINNGDYVTITGEDGNDIINSVPLDSLVSVNRYVKIYGGGGDDEILSAGEETTIYGGSGNDNISNMNETAGNVVIFGETGNDKITNKGNNAKIYGGEEDDTIGNTGGSNVSINGGTGNDSIVNTRGSNVKIDGGDDNDIIRNGGSSVTITSGNGKDTILNSGRSVIVNGGDGDDSVENQGASVTVDVGGGNDFIYNYGGSVKIIGGAGNDKIHHNYGNSVTIDGGMDNDYIDNYSVLKASIDAGTGDDSIYNNYGKLATIDGGAGDDYITNSESNYVIVNGGSGDDTICNGSRGRGEDSEKVSIDGGTGNDSIVNYGNSVKINGDAGNDYIYNYIGKSVSIDSGVGDDSIFSYGYNVTINSGSGNDSIEIYGDDVTIDSGTGDDSITIFESKHVTIDGGSGNDKISLSPYYANSLIQYKSGDGDDTVSGFNSRDTLKISDGNYSTQESGNDVIVTVGDGSILLKDAKGQALNIIGTYKPYTPPAYNSLIISLTGGTDTYSNTLEGATILALGGNDSVTNSSANVLIDGGDGDDWIYNSNFNSRIDNVSINGGEGKDSIINHNEYAIINAGNGDDRVENKASYVKIYGGNGNDSIYSGEDNVTINGGGGNDRINLSTNALNNLIQYASGDGNDTVYGFNETYTLSISGGNYSTQEIGNDVIVTVGEGSIRLKDAKGQSLNIVGTYKPYTPPADTTLTITNADKSPLTLESSIEVADASSRTKAVKITGNSLDNTITSGTGNDTLDGAAGNDNLTGGKGNDVFVYTAGDDTITDYATGDKISLNASIKSFGASGDDFVFKFNDGSLTLTDAASKKISLTSGKVTNVYTDEGIFNTAGTAVTLNASATNYTADSKITTIDAGLTSGVEITGNTKSNKILLGDGDDVVIWLAKSGNDTLYNFGENDLLSVVGAISDGSVKSGNTYLKIGSNKITVKDSAQVTFADNDGTKIFDGGLFYDENKISATLGSAVKEFDSTDTDVVDITGNAKANKLVAGNKDTTLTGGMGNDIFVHTGGNDLITDYGNGSDKISLGAATIENFSANDGNVKLDLDKGSITIANGAGKKISLVSGKKTTANIFTDEGIFDTSGKAVTLNASATNYTADKSVVTIDAGLTSSATVTGNSKANTVYFGDENVFVWAKGGNDTLMNFGADDLLSVVGAVSDGSVKGGNTYLKIGLNKITVKDSAQVTFADNDATRIFDGGIFYDTDKTSATLASATKDFDAADTDVVDITGNTKANKLVAGDKNTTLEGGNGNDSLWGGNGEDTFIYRATKKISHDTIYDYENDELLQILDVDDNFVGIKKAVLIKNTLTLTLDNKGSIILKGVTSDTSFNINGNSGLKYNDSSKTLE